MCAYARVLYLYLLVNFCFEGALCVLIGNIMTENTLEFIQTCRQFSNLGLLNFCSNQGFSELDSASSAEYVDAIMMSCVVNKVCAPKRKRSRSEPTTCDNLDVCDSIIKKARTIDVTSQISSANKRIVNLKGAQGDEEITETVTESSVSCVIINKTCNKGLRNEILNLTRMVQYLTHSLIENIYSRMNKLTHLKIRYYKNGRCH